MNSPKDYLTDREKIKPLVCNFTEMEIFTNTFGMSGPERDLIKIGKKLNEVISWINKNGK